LRRPPFKWGSGVTKLLIVDDDENSRQVLIDALDHGEFSITEAGDGEQALLAVAQDPPDVILLDIMMPGVDGMQVCDAVKQAGDTRKIPIIMVTALGEERDVLRGLEAGASDYITKPISGVVVRARVRAALRSKLAHDEVELLASQVSAKNRKLARFADTAERFMDDVSHDFRSPLTVIREFALIIADGIDGPVTPQQKEHVGIIVNAVDDLARMVDDLLDSSRLRAGSLRVDRRRHSVQEILDSVRPVITSKARRKGIRLIEDIAPHLDDVFADREMVSRVLVNLAVNAVKFSPKAAEVRLWARAGESSDVEIGISDHGRGMSHEQLQVVFDRFSQTGKQTGSAKGYGLGLSIARELVALNLGKLEVASEPGRGSTFSFTLPTCEPEVILERYFDQLAKVDAPTDQVAVLRASTPDAGLCREDVHAFLTGTCYPMDLILDGGDGRSVLAVALTAQPGPWMRRLHARWADIVSDDPNEDKPEVHIEHIGSWSHRHQKKAVFSLLIEQLAGRVRV